MSVDHYENFPVASHFVPPRMRGAVVAIYRFARAADDLADEGEASDAERLAALAGYGRALDAVERGQPPATPPFPALAEAIARHHLPLGLFRNLLSAFAQDVTTKRYGTFAALSDYCARSANPVGRLMLALYGSDTPAARTASDAICTGLQLTNFWQDVAMDWRKGRVYLPQEDLACFGVTEDDIGRGRTGPSWRALMAFETGRAHALLEAGRPLLRALPWRLRVEIGGVIAGGQRILARIDAVDGDVFAQRPTLSTRDWVAVGWRTLWPRKTRVPFAQ